MSASKVTPIKAAAEFTTVKLHNIVRPTMDHETAMHSMHALFVAIKELNTQEPGVYSGEVQSLAYLGEYIADQLTDRI